MALEQRRAVYNVDGQALTFVKAESYKGPLLVNTFGAYTLELRFSREWKEFDRIALYLQAAGAAGITLDLEDPLNAQKLSETDTQVIYLVNVPSQILKSIGQITVGVTGYKSNDTSFRFPTTLDSSFKVTQSTPNMEAEVLPQQVSVVEKIFLQLYAQLGAEVTEEQIQAAVNQAITEGKITNYDDTEVRTAINNKVDYSELLKKYVRNVPIELKKDSGLSTATITQLDSTHVKVQFPSDNTNYYCYQSIIDSVANLKGKHVLITVTNNGTSDMTVPNKLLLSIGKNWGEKLKACTDIDSTNISAGETRVYDFDINTLTIADETRDIYLIVGSEKQSFDFLFTVSCDVVTYNSKEYFVKYAQQAETAKQATHADTATRLESTSNIIACFGDSLTQGAPVYGAKAYPGKLQTLLGNSYQVINQGIGGETAQGILARQGSMPAVVQPFTIPADTTAVDITLKNSINANVLWPQNQLDMKVNPVTINGIEGTLTESTDESNIYHYKFTRSVAGDEVVVDRPALLQTAQSKVYADAIQILWFGQNGTWTDAEELVSMYRAAVRHLKTDRYLVIGLSSDTAAVREPLEKKMQYEFGERYINIRKYLVEYGLTDAGLTATDNDTSQIAQGLVPESLRADAVHFTEAGYASIAKAVYSRGKYLGYWE